MSYRTEVGFDVIHAKAGEAARMARVPCHKCTATLEIPMPGKLLPPNVVAKFAARAGWRMDGERRSSNRCPACIGGKTQHSLDNTPPLNPAKVIPMAEAKAAGPRELTQPERLKIRAILDKHFDDGAGCWLEGYSDQKAGEEIGVPWAFVTKVREAAYGPIRVDPEVAALKAELAQIGRDIAALTEKHAAAEKRLAALVSKRAAA